MAVLESLECMQENVDTGIEILKLQKRYLLFAEAILKGEKPHDAVITAGYKARNRNTRYQTAKRLLDHPLIQKYIKARFIELQRTTNITIDEVQGNAREILNRSLQRVPVVVDGGPTGEWKYDSFGAINANKQLMQLAGLDKTDKGARTLVNYTVNIYRDGDEKIALPEGKKFIDVESVPSQADDSSDS